MPNNIYNQQCNETIGCHYEEPHRHGYACDFECLECGGIYIAITDENGNEI